MSSLRPPPPSSRRRRLLLLCTTICFALLAVLPPLFFSRLRSFRLPPPHLLGHPLIYEQGLVPTPLGRALLARAISLREFPTNVNDLAFYKTRHEHIGEATPIGPNGTCAHPFLTPSADRTLCVLPGRIDVGRAFVLSGGVEGLKETHQRLVTRVQSFGRYHFVQQESDAENNKEPPNDAYHGIPEAAELFSLPAFSRLARSVCPPTHQILDPFQFNFIVNLPGQTVAAHTDAPYFWGADRFHVPQWLLAVMVHSNLFSDDFVHQVQVVAYIHDWEGAEGHDDDAQGDGAATTHTGGHFFFWNTPTGIPKSVPPRPYSGSAVDGSKVVHAAGVYRPHDVPPILDKSRQNILRHTTGDRSTSDEWELLSDGVSLRTYLTSDLRVSIVYRARCFASEEERRQFAALHQRAVEGDESAVMPLVLSLEEEEEAWRRESSAASECGEESEEGGCSPSPSEGSTQAPQRFRGGSILGRLMRDLVRRGKAPSVASLMALPRLDLAMLLLDEYIKYPLSHTARIPINYCAAKLLLPRWLGGALDLVCDG